MCICRFCSRAFESPQAVKAHLRTCRNYLRSKHGNATRGQPFTPPLYKSISPPPGPPTPNETVQPSNPYASFVDQITQKLADPDEATRLRQKRQALLTGLCTTLVDWYRPSEGVITPEMVAAAKVAILDELGALAIEALPQAELTLRGAAIRNRIFAPYVWRQQELVAHQNEQQQQDALRIQHEASIRARQLKRKAMLIELGITRALQSASSRGILHRALVVLEWEVRARLEAWLVGDETDSQVDETIEAAIDRPLLEWEARVEQYQSAQRQRIMDHCLTVALPVVEAAVPWVKAVVVRTICETLGMQSPPSSPRNEAGASSTNEAAPDNSDAPTPRQVRRRRVSPASPPMDRGEASATQTAPSASSEKWTASN